VPPPLPHTHRQRLNAPHDGATHLDKLDIGFGKLLGKALALLDRLHQKLDAVQVCHTQLPIDVVVRVLFQRPRIPRCRQQDHPQEVLKPRRILVSCACVHVRVCACARVSVCARKRMRA